MNTFSLYLGPQGENEAMYRRLLNRVLEHHAAMRRSAYPGDPSLYPPGVPGNSALEAALERLLERAGGNIPYFHPRYNAQMLKDPPVTAVLGYLAFMLSNPNNHAYEGGPVTTEMEMEVTDMLLRMCGFAAGWGHLSSGGSLANTEALWAVRDFYGGGNVYFSEASHYSWKRICNILAIPGWSEITVDASFRMDLDCLEEKLKSGKTLAVIANAGSTGTGSVDDIEGLLALKEKYGFHLHADAAYGGFFRSLLLDDEYHLLPAGAGTLLTPYTRRQLTALQGVDSVTIDPHKQGLLPYGAGAVLYKDTALRNVILNTAPYTYHQPDKPNIGMFSLEGSRPGAMAAACWLTYTVLPPVNSGIGGILRGSLAASQYFAGKIAASGVYANLNMPDLDINCFYRAGNVAGPDAVDAATLDVYRRFSVEAENPEFILSKFVLPRDLANRVLFPGEGKASGSCTALRAVFIKHWCAEKDFYYINRLLEALLRAAGQ